MAEKYKRRKKRKIPRMSIEEKYRIALEFGEICDRNGLMRIVKELRKLPHTKKRLS